MNTVAKTPIIIRAGEGLTADAGDHGATIKISPMQSGAGILFCECHAKFGGGVPPHIHHNEDEVFYVQSGRIEFMIGNNIIEAEAGDTVYAPCDIAHAWKVISTEGAHFLAIMTPGANFEQFGIAMTQLGINPQETMNDPAKAAAFVALAASYGIEMLPPIK